MSLSPDVDVLLHPIQGLLTFLPKRPQLTKVVFEKFTGEVRSNGVELPTFDTRAPPPECVDMASRKTVKYVQAEADTGFEVFLKLNPSAVGPDDPSHLSIDLHSDG
jgi:hypothetical protein